MRSVPAAAPGASPESAGMALPMDDAQRPTAGMAHGMVLVLSGTGAGMNQWSSPSHGPTQGRDQLLSIFVPRC